RVRKAVFHTISQIGISYRRSPLSRTIAAAKGAPQAGDRFPWLRLKFQPNGAVEDLFERLDDTRFNLIAIGQPTPSAEALGFGDLLRIHAVPLDAHNTRALAAASIPSPSFYLLRPDGHIGLAGAAIDAGELDRWRQACHLRQ